MAGRQGLGRPATEGCPLAGTVGPPAKPLAIYAYCCTARAVAPTQQKVGFVGCGSWDLCA